MAPPDPLPEYMYKIVTSAPPDPIPASYPPSELDQKDGFIHLSVATQIPHTADLFFQDLTALWILKIRLVPKFHGITNWDVPGCPHLYGNFGADDVESVREFGRRGRGDGEEDWKGALGRQGEGWLV
ncbi:hypothetical protein F4778DRAFT_739863 [Xylariomycetidae sp. FL2044]|nr:hypothetical protein F4778DRAFT_739863 [Xylariomycetidae sp. FL2044]